MPAQQRSILVINPNTSKAMTDALTPLISSLGLQDTRFEYFTAPSGVPSINNEDDAQVSADHCLPVLSPVLSQHDAFLVCCYSQHPLVPLLRARLAATDLGGKSRRVAGIFEASVAAVLQSIDVQQRFGIVSTGSQWRGILDHAVSGLLGSSSSSRYAGTETTGLDASELHSADAVEVEHRLAAATKRLLAKDAKAICLGCAGMSGMDKIVRGACVAELGPTEGKRIVIIDGVLIGVGFLDGALRASA